MEEVIWIEVVSRSREVIARHRCRGPEIRIGRGYENDVVLDDPYVAPQHLRIRRSEAGGWVAEDLDSANGLFLDHGRDRFGWVEIDGNRPIRIGHTYLRLREAGYAVMPERAYQPRSRLWPVLAALGVLLVAIQVGSNWIGETSEPKLSPYLVSVLTVLELTKQTQIFATNLGSWVIPGTLCAGLYLAMSLPLAALARRMELRWRTAPQ